MLPALLLLMAASAAAPAAGPAAVHAAAPAAALPLPPPAPASRAYQVYTYATNERTAIVEHMTQLLYQRTAASQAAVLHTLAAELAG